eukprot:CAMPEP_0183308736 /NCGR_PEP_ID=MMETSP0160_2-20130417/22429_1 /TAXON_ID=2839 ORGANISM="Odontella Sinensis, Strain Grunow 1884" /NCGR_SAMPLE_ID=MMETSP0160_2 /ASSEMBLY_ACC=CAM_ASM_000250 /LENGTH=306 /DNA_ID=CAMNT_0025472621 /DNA_START=113 /DNA_END=1033 /DNA_ORIENTATION=-
MSTSAAESFDDPTPRGALGRRPKIVLLGDSLTQLSFSPSLSGWGAALADAYQRRADVLNRGMSGYNTDWYLRYLRTEGGMEDALGCGEDIVAAVVFFGANDASHPELNARQHVPLERYKANLKEIIGMVKEATGGRAKAIVVGPPPVDHAGRLRYQVERYGDKATGELERTLELSGKYAAAASEVAKEVGVPYLDLWGEMQQEASSPVTKGDQDETCEKEEPWARYLSDGLHFSREGNNFVGECLLQLFQEEYPDLSVTPCPRTGFWGNSASTCLGLQQSGPWHDVLGNAESVEKAFGDSKEGASG